MKLFSFVMMIDIFGLFFVYLITVLKNIMLIKVGKPRKTEFHLRMMIGRQKKLRLSMILYFTQKAEYNC